MKVNHSTFSGGYKFTGFEGQAKGSINLFQPQEEVNGSAIKTGNGITSVAIFEELGVSAFSGPSDSIYSTQGFIKPEQVKDIVVSLVEVEPYDLPSGILLKNGGKEKFLDGLKSIHKDYSSSKITVVIGDEQSSLIGEIEPMSANVTWMEVATITSKYPANLKELAIPTVLGKKYPVGYGPAHIGVLFLSINHVLLVEKAINGKPAASTYVALSGPGWKENVVIEVLVGTPIKTIKDAYLAEGDIRVSRNTALKNQVLTDKDVVDYNLDVMIALPEDRERKALFFFRPGKNVDSYTNAFISRLMPKASKTAGTNLYGERRPCVSCTYCQNVCPVGLIPHLLHKHVDKDILNKRVAEYKIFDCIECGLCDYVCPSKIEISSDIIKGKDGLEKVDVSHNKYLLAFCDMVSDLKEEAEDE